MIEEIIMKKFEYYVENRYGIKPDDGIEITTIMVTKKIGVFQLKGKFKDYHEGIDGKSINTKALVHISVYNTQIIFLSNVDPQLKDFYKFFKALGVMNHYD